MANELSDISAALATIRSNFSIVATGIQDQTRASEMQKALRVAIAKELFQVLAPINPEWAYSVRSLGGVGTVAALASEYSELGSY